MIKKMILCIIEHTFDKITRSRIGREGNTMDLETFIIIYESLDDDARACFEVYLTSVEQGLAHPEEDS